MSEPVIEVKGLGKRFEIGSATGGYTLLTEQIAERLRRRGKRPKMQEFWALQDIDFEVQQGETFGVIGHNGAGKSTLLKILSRITPPTVGEATLRGRVGALLEVGTGFHPELTGRENVFLNGAILNMKRTEIQRRFDEIVEFAEICPFIDTPVKRSSSGTDTWSTAPRQARTSRSWSATRPRAGSLPPASTSASTSSRAATTSL